MIKESYKDLESQKDGMVNMDQGAVYFTYEYVEFAEKLGFTEV